MGLKPWDSKSRVLCGDTPRTCRAGLELWGSICSGRDIMEACFRYLVEPFKEATVRALTKSEGKTCKARAAGRLRAQGDLLAGLKVGEGPRAPESPIPLN